MIEVAVQDVIVRIYKEVRWPGPGVHRRVLLRERDGERLLHLWAGADDGDAIALQLAGQTPPRPMIFDTAAQLMALGALSATSCWIQDLDHEAILTIRAQDGREQTLSLRPTDAINLALRWGAPLFVEEALLDQAGIPPSGLWEALEQEEAEFQAHLADHLPPGAELAFPRQGELEWRSIVPPEWRLLSPLG